MSTLRRLEAMPAKHPRLLHLTPYLIGDSLRALWLLILSRCWGIDQNGQVDANGVCWIMHWPKLGRNGWRWVWTGEHDAKGREVRRRMTKAERNRLVQSVPYGFMIRLRTRKRGGSRPYTALTHMRRLATLNAKRRAAGKAEKVWCLEVKDNPRFLEDDVWLNLRHYLEVTGVLMVCMTLQRTQADSRRAFRVLELAVQHLGVPVAVLPRAAKPADWETRWVPLGVQVWGRWR